VSPNRSKSAALARETIAILHRCGVFRNEPGAVAGWFHEHLTGEGAFAGAFRRVVFAVLGWTDDRHFIDPFERAFGSAG
jgi:uncharacterized protein (TIGR02452 family)